MPIEVYKIFTVALIYVVYKVCMEIKGYKEDRAKERIHRMVDDSINNKREVT